MANSSVKCSTGLLVQILLAGLILFGPAGHLCDPIRGTDRSASERGLATAKFYSPPLLMADRKESSRPKSEREAARDPEPADSRPSDRNQSGSAGGSTKKPATPFNPTERIKADQAVDFPSDI